MRETSTNPGTNIPLYDSVICTVKTLFNRLAALMFSSDFRAKVVKTISRGYHFKVFAVERDAYKRLIVISVTLSFSFFGVEITIDIVQ